MSRDGRLALGWSQTRLGAKIGVSRSHIAAIELGRANPSLEVVARLAAALGFELEILLRAPVVVGDRRQRDAVHARCSGYVDRRLLGAGWQTAREVEVIEGRWRGWIDLLAFDQRSGTLLVIEIKTRIDDMGAIERQLGWYERLARRVARSRGWEVRHVQTWLLVLRTAEVDAALIDNRDILDLAFPVRAASMGAIVATSTIIAGNGRGVAAIDPHRRGRRWLVPTRLDGQRSVAPYRDYRDAAERLGGGRDHVTTNDGSRTNVQRLRPNATGSAPTPAPSSRIRHSR